MERPLTRRTWLPLLVVDEAAQRGEGAPFEPSFGLRLALAYLHSIPDGAIFALRNRRYNFDHFWKAVAEPVRSGTRLSPRAPALP